MSKEQEESEEKLYPEGLPSDYDRIKIVLSRGEDRPIETFTSFRGSTSYGSPPTKKERETIRQMFLFTIKGYDEIDALGL